MLTAEPGSRTQQHGPEWRGFASITGPSALSLAVVYMMHLQKLRIYITHTALSTSKRSASGASQVNRYMLPDALLLHGNVWR